MGPVWMAATSGSSPSGVLVAESQPAGGTVTMRKRPHAADPDRTASESPELRADCARCVGLCCVAPAFSASADFAVDKPAGQPCLHLQQHSCAIHAELRPRGFPGCTVYDCFGAGQQVTQVTFGGRSWRDDPGSATLMFDVFVVVRQLHELLWYLSEALSWPAAAPVRTDLEASQAETLRWRAETAERLADMDVAALRARVNNLLTEASELVRGKTRRGVHRRVGDSVGRKLRGTDLRWANLRGALLIGADLRDCDLRLADLIGADLRGADLRGADLSTTLFLTQQQIAAARGDATTRLPSKLRVPSHWPVQADRVAPSLLPGS